MTNCLNHIIHFKIFFHAVNLNFIEIMGSRNRRRRRRRVRAQLKKNKTTDNTSEHAQCQFTCTSCKRPINQNNFHSKKMNSLCGSCFKRNFKENERRKIHKKISINKRKARKIKNYLQQY